MLPSVDGLSTVSNRASRPSPHHYPSFHCRLGAPASQSLTGAWCCPHDPVHHLVCPSPVNLREAETGDSVASVSACAVTAASAARQQGCLPNSATFPSRRLGQPRTSPTTAAQIRERKTAHPATIPQRHCLAVKQRDSTEAGPPGAPPPPSPHRLSMGAPNVNTLG